MNANIPGFLGQKNRENTARWMWQSHLRGGSMHVKARDLQDMRNEEDMRRWRYIEIRLVQARRELRLGTVVMLARLRAARTRRQAS